MPRRKTIVTVGDVFSLNLTKGFGLIQYVKEGGEGKLDFIRVLPGVYDAIDKAVIDNALVSEGLFFTQTPLKYAVNKKYFKPCGNYHIPKNSVCPRYFRSEPILDIKRGGWDIVDSETWKRRRVMVLSQEEQRLSSWSIPSISGIVEKIENNWTPLEWV